LNTLVNIESVLGLRRSVYRSQQSIPMTFSRTGSVANQLAWKPTPASLT